MIGLNKHIDLKPMGDYIRTEPTKCELCSNLDSIRCNFYQILKAHNKELSEHINDYGCPIFEQDFSVEQLINNFVKDL